MPIWAGSVTDMEEAKTARRRVLLARGSLCWASRRFSCSSAFAFSHGPYVFAFQDWFSVIAGVIVMIFGAHFVGVFRIRFLDREVRVANGR